MDDKTSSGMTIFNKKKSKNTNQGRERRRGLPKVAESSTEEKTEAVTEEQTVSQGQKTARNSDNEKVIEETPEKTTDEPTSVDSDSATDEALGTTNTETSVDGTNTETGPEPKQNPVSDTPKSTKKPKDNRKQIKLPPRLMEKIDAIKMMQKKTAYYEVLEEMVDFYVKQSFDDNERIKFDTIMSIFNDD